jgi:hypothetical protein
MESENERKIVINEKEIIRRPEKEKQIVIRNDFAREKDIKIEHLTQQIDARRNMLLSKQTALKMASQQNQFLNMVRDDYAKYYEVIAQQKHDQLEALKTIDKYVTDLKHSDDMTDRQIDEITKDQMRLIKEMRDIRGNINTLTRK